MSSIQIGVTASITLEATCRLCDLLTHLYVLIPVLDNDKHYWIGDDEVEKLLKRGKGWLEKHPEREQIVYRYLRHRRDLARDAIARLVAEGKLLRLLLQEKTFEKITGMDVSYRALELTRERLHLDRLSEKQRERITLLHGALT